MKVVIRPATAADFAVLVEMPLPYRVRAFAAVRGDEVLGVGGLGFKPDGTVVAFVHAAPGAQRFKVAFHRAGLMAMAEARRLGLRRVVATAETQHPRAEAWLERLGFRPRIIDGITVWVWERT